MPLGTLMVRGGPSDGQMIFLSAGPTRIGRVPGNNIVVDSPGVSREHAVIRGEPDGFFIADLGSTNGTYVNGVRLGGESHRLKNRDVIQVGGLSTDVRWVFMRSADTVEPPRAAAP